MEKIEDLHNKELTDILSNIEKLGNTISDLREVTYKYISYEDGTDFNESFFIDFIGLDIPEDDNYKKEFIKDKLEGDESFSLFLTSEFNLKIDTIYESIGKIKDEINLNDIDNKDYLLESIEVFENALAFSSVALKFELEKAGLTTVSDSEAYELIDNLDYYDEKLFGPKISNNLEYLIDTYKIIYNKNDSNLDKYLEILKDKIIVLGGEIPEFVDSEYIEKNKYQETFEELSNVVVEREDYKEIFNLFFELIGVPQRADIGNYSSFYDGDNAYGIPNTDKYKEKDLAKLIKILTHEGTHYINAKVSKDRGLPKLQGDMIKEEGLAMIFEDLISGKKIEDIDYMTVKVPYVIMSHLLNGDECKDFIREYDGSLDTVKEFLRKKRGYSLKLPGGPNKDASYSLGKFLVLEYLNNGGKLKNLFSGKVGMDKVKSGDFIPDDFGNKYLYPLIFSELIIFYYLFRENYNHKNSDNFHESFIKYLKEKYSEFDGFFELFDETERIIESQKMKILKIIGYIKK